MRLPGSITVMFVALLVAGCNLAPKYQRPVVETSNAFKETNGWKRAEPSDQLIRSNWWVIFNDPLLSSLEEQCTRSNQTVKAAFFTFLQERAIARQAWASLFPTATVQPAVQRSRESSSGGTGIVTGTGTGSSNSTSTATATLSRSGTFYSLPFDASWEPDFWGSLRNTLKANEYTAQSSAATLQNTLLMEQADLAADYYQLRSQDSLKKLLNDTVAAYSNAYNFNLTQYRTGIVSDENVAQAETQLKTIQAQATGADIQRQQLEHAIAVLVGQPPSTFSIPVAPLSDKAPTIPLTIPSALLERRPDISAAERTVASANAEIGVARAAFFPTVTLSGSIGWQDSRIESLFSGPAFIWTLAGSAAESLFDAGRRRAVTQQAWATYQQAVANYRQTVFAAFQSVEDNLVSLRVLDTEISQQDAAVEASQRFLNISMNRYRLGIDSYLNVITAETTLLSNQETALTLRQNRMTSSVQLVMSLGGGWSASDLPTPGQASSSSKLSPP